MEDHAFRYLRYTRATLADSLRQTPDLSRNAANISPAEYTRGKLGAESVRKLFRQRRQQVKPQIPDDKLWPLTVVVAPWLYVRQSQNFHQNKAVPPLIAPILVWAKVMQDGSLLPYEAPGLRPQPFVPRELLEPSEKIVTLGRLEEADAIYSTLGDVEGKWSTLVAQADELISKLTGCPPTSLELNTHILQEHGCCLLNTPRAAHLHIQTLTDITERSPALPAPLYETLLRAAADRPLKSGAELLELSEEHLAQMESRYPLAESQREALLHQLALWKENPSILAVDGPPGTGKTTLLLSVIATLWVEHALVGGPPPLIVAASTNTQAVVNILHAFSKVEEKESPWVGRWLPDARTYGLFMCSKGREDITEEKDFPIETFVDMGDQAQFSARRMEDRTGFAEASKTFLARYSVAFPDDASPSLESARNNLQSRLEETVASTRRAMRAARFLAKAVSPATLTANALEHTRSELGTLMDNAQRATAQAAERVDACLRIRYRWKQHLASEPWWIGLLCLLGIQSPRQKRDILFGSELELTERQHVDSTLRKLTSREDIGSWVDRQLTTAEAVHREALNEEVPAQKNLLTFTAELEEVTRWITEGDLTLDALQAALDTGPRFDAFKIATHYWEARYLLEVEARLRSIPPERDYKSKGGLLTQYHRLAKVFPCFVCTLYMLPKYFTAWEKPKDEPLYNTIDLLIIDEAGQVSPEIGTPAFLLAKRALVVGDVDQLSPVWNVGSSVDRRNARRHGVIAEDNEYDDLQRVGRAAWKGNLMRTAQESSPFAKNPSRGRGMFLSEHRRCWPEIISICNSLVYGGLLRPMRAEGPRLLLPSVGYVHIAGTSQSEGTSRKNPTEALAIAKWIASRKKLIEEAFQGDGKPFRELVAVITPFSAQARVIRQMLRAELGDGNGITVGTVHSLQGAECRVVIFSPTYGPDASPGSTFFDHDRSMLNVAVSRAQDAFLVFGNMDLFRPVGNHPAAILGRHLFRAGENELTDVPLELLVPALDLEHTELIHEPQAHRAVLRRALSDARFRVVIVSPFLRHRALEADDILGQIAHICAPRATGMAPRVVVVTDEALNGDDRTQYRQCIQSLQQAGASVYGALKSGVHSKLLLVDNRWLVVGSFNWLSAVRDEGHRLARHESSIRYDGPKAVEMIMTSLRDLRQILESSSAGA